MSFSGEMKEEIARLIPEKEEEVRAELMAIIRFCGRILRQEESVAVFMETENVVLAKTYVKLIKRAFDLQVQLEIRRHGTGKYNQYFILLSERRRTCCIRKNGRNDRNCSRHCRLSVCGVPRLIPGDS